MVKLPTAEELVHNISDHLPHSRRSSDEGEKDDKDSLIAALLEKTKLLESTVGRLQDRLERGESLSTTY